MARDKLRHQVAIAAARRMLQHNESFHQAKLQAARELIPGWVHPRYLPTHREIRAELEHLTRLSHQHDPRLLNEQQPADRFVVYERLLAPLEQVIQSPVRHPEGDALYHSLQVFELARQQLPYDEEFLLAALLHDVGKALDVREPITAALAALGETITSRTAWLIENRPLGHAMYEGTLGQRARRRLTETELYEDLMLLVDCDLGGRRQGVAVMELREALDYIRSLEYLYGDRQPPETASD